jgi:hypothetical protein
MHCHKKRILYFYLSRNSLTAKVAKVNGVGVRTQDLLKRYFTD